MSFPVDMQYIKRTEVKLGRRLPLGYIARMCRENGGEVSTESEDWSLYPIYDDSDRKRITRTCNDIVREMAAARGWRDFPADALAIGDNGCGDKLVLLAEPESDRYSEDIYIWYHETGELEKAADDISELSDKDA